MKTIYTLIAAFISLTPSLVAAAWTFPVSDAYSIIEEEYSYYCTKDANFKPNIAANDKFFKTAKGILNFSYQPNLTCWTKIEIINASTQSILVYLVHDNPSTDHLHLTQKLGSEVVASDTLGFLYDFRKQKVFYRAPIFKIRLDPGLNSFLIQQRSRDLMVLTWKIANPDYFSAFASYENLLLGGFLAVCFSLALYNLTIFLASRDNLHFYYFSYLSSYAVAQMFVAGIFRQYLLPDSVLYRQGFGLATVVFALILTSYFAYNWLALREFKATRWLFYGYFAASVICLLSNLLGYYSLAAQMTLVLTGIDSFLVTFFAIFAIMKKRQLAKLFALAWSFLLVGNLIQVLLLAGILPHLPLFIMANFIGACMEAILISYALAYRMRQEKSLESDKRQHAFLQLEKMVLPHQMEMMRSGSILEKTMPLMQSSATVICLDIIGSTKSQIVGMKSFLRRFLDSCQDAINIDYNGQSVVSSGYRIKELGDGLLCSVGFPLALPAGKAEEQLALELSLKFFAAFDHNFGLENSTQPCYCSIGIAQGKIEGFFTLAGMKSYEMFGEAIVWATRYEALRKVHHLPQNAHIITLQSGVWEKLLPRHQQLFFCQRLDAHSAIKNNEEANEFYYCEVQSGEASNWLAELRSPL